MDQEHPVFGPCPESVTPTYTTVVRAAPALDALAGGQAFERLCELAAHTTVSVSELAWYIALLEGAGVGRHEAVLFVTGVADQPNLGGLIDAVLHVAEALDA